MTSACAHISRQNLMPAQTIAKDSENERIKDREAEIRELMRAYYCLLFCRTDDVSFA